MSVAHLLNKIKKIEFDKFIDCAYSELQVNDIIASCTNTNSQKYFNRAGYEDYNRIKYGILLVKHPEYPFKSIILEYDEINDSFIETSLCANVGTSGWCSFQRAIP